MSLLRYVTLFLLLLSFSVMVSAQEGSCSFKLEEAENLYETGVLDSIPSMLRGCMADGFDDDELSRAYKLLILTYLFEDYQEMAELTMLKFLKKFPEYELKANDPVEFKYLYESYQTVPVFSIGAVGGINYSFIRVIEPFGLSYDENVYGEYTSAGVGYQAGVQFIKYVNEHIDIHLDVIYNARKFDYTIQQLDSRVEYDENQSILSFPLTGTYNYRMGMISAYARLGFSVDYRMSSTAGLSRYVDDNAGIDDITGSDLDILADRSEINLALVGGGGLKYHVKKGYVMLDIRYHFGVTNQVVEENRFANDEKWANYQYVDDDFAMNNLFISAGYVFSIFKTRKK